MEQEQKLHTSVLLVICGLLLLVIGSLITYIFMPQQVVEVPTPPERDRVVNEETAEDVAYIVPTAPEDYAVPEPNVIDTISLPEPDTNGTTPVATALNERRSDRSYSDTSMSLADLSQMLWAGIGVSNQQTGLRTTPSRGEAYPIGYYVVVNRVTDLEQGLYLYQPETHELALVQAGDQTDTWDSMTGQPHPSNAAAVLLMTANMARGDSHYATTLQESGHVGQNLYLQAVERDLAMLVMGGFDKEVARDYLNIDDYHQVVYLVPIGNRVAD